MLSNMILRKKFHLNWALGLTWALCFMLVTGEHTLLRYQTEALKRRHLCQVAAPVALS